MQIAAVTDPLKTGCPVMALLGIHVHRFTWGIPD